jgi:hypothetical protein
VAAVVAPARGSATAAAQVSATSRERRSDISDPFRGLAC